MKTLHALHRMLIATVGCLCFSSIAAQTDDQDSAPEPDPIFDIEVIVFEYVSGVKGAREDWRYIDSGREAAQAEHTLKASAKTLDEPAQDDDVSGADTDVVEFKPLTFEVLTDEQLRLDAQLTKLRNSRDFRPLIHTGWRQPIYASDNETTLDLARVARMPATLDGTASVYVSRFLHLTLALDLADNRVGGGTSTDSVIFSLDERRKMRSGELHFFDHPRFGALALISRTDTETTASEPSN
ncbi:MAG: CsiV family protein [Pseudomonadota bacterium]